MRRERVDSLLNFKPFCGEESSCLHLSRRERFNSEADRQPVNFRSVVGLLVFEHTVDGVQEFTFDGDQGLHFQCAVGQQVLVYTRA